jgi:hypothetical protein
LRKPVAQQIQGHVVCAGDVRGLEVGWGVHVDQPRRVAGGDQVPQGEDPSRTAGVLVGGVMR